MSLVFPTCLMQVSPKPTQLEPVGSGDWENTGSLIPIQGAEWTLYRLGSGSACPACAASPLQTLWHLQCHAPEISDQATYFSFQKGRPSLL